MVTSDTIAVPQSPEEAYQVYRDAASAVFLAGAQGLKYKKDHYGLIVDLSKAGLRYIRDAGDEVAIGAMTTLDDLEKSPVVQAIAGGAICRCIRDIKNSDEKKATIGGVVAVKAPFSVVLPVLMSLRVDVVLEGKGRMNLADYIPCPPMREMVSQVVIAKEEVYTAFAAYRKLPTDEPYLTGAVAALDDEWRVVVGGRPGVAQALAIGRVCKHGQRGADGKGNGRTGECGSSGQRGIGLCQLRYLLRAGTAEPDRRHGPQAD